MRTIKTRIGWYREFEINLFISEELFQQHIQENHEDLENERHLAYISLESALEEERNRIIDLVDICDSGKNYKLAVLRAHGAEHRNKWLYTDHERLYSVQRWVDRNDQSYFLMRNYAALIIDVCNPGGRTLTSKRTPLFYPKGLISMHPHPSGII